MAALTLESVKDRVTGSAVGRAALMYLPICWLVLQITDTFVQQFGLPRWVFAGAFVLMTVGLAVVGLSALAADRARRAAESGAPASRRWPSKRRLALGGAAALVAWAVITAGYMGARASGVGPFGTLVASGRVAQGGEVLIADFANRTKDPDLDEAVRQALTIDLGQSRLVQVADPREVASALQRMQRDPAAPLTPELAREVARREGYAAVLSGELSSLGPATLLSATLTSPKTGETLASFEQRARKPEELLDAVDRLTGDLRNKIGESLKVLRAEAPLEQVTTASLPALRLYSEASKAMNAGDWTKAARLFRRAVEFDGSFAMGWRGLGLALYNEGRDLAGSEAALEVAYRHRERLPDRERGLTEGAYWNTRGEWRNARDAYARVLENYPDDLAALNAMGLLERQLGRVEAGLAVHQRAAALPPPRVPAHLNVFLTQLDLGRAADAEATLAKAGTLFPDSFRVELMRVTLLKARQEWDGAEAALAALRRDHPEPEAAYEADFAEMGLRAARGDLASLAGVAERVAAVDAGAGLSATALLDLTALAWTQATYGMNDQARATLARALQRYPLDAMAARERPYRELAELAARLGDPAAARRYLALAAERGGRDPNIFYGGADATAGWIALAEGRPAEAVERFRAAAAFGIYGRSTMAWPLGHALEAAGRPDEARAVYRRYAAALNTHTIDLGPALERLALLEAAAGDHAAAAEASRRLAALWTAPEVRPRVLAVQSRIGQPVQTARLAVPAR